MIMMIAWYWVDHVEKNKSPFYSCKTDSLELKMSDDRAEVLLRFENGRNLATPVLHTYFAGTGECETATYIFSHNNETYGLSNLGCGPQEMFESGAKGHLYVGQWTGANENQYDWTGNFVEFPSSVKDCF
jgi:hypothetical protein